MMHANQQDLIALLRDAGIREDVLAIMETVPRELFVDAATLHQAFENIPLPIGWDQTISQPYIVGKMTEALWQSSMRRVLEIGTGSGYQAAILSQCAGEVYTLERVQSLHAKAKARLQSMALSNVHVFHADGSKGMPDVAPFDGILVTAAMLEVPHVLLSQLAIDGRLVAPVGKPGAQTLQVITRTPLGFEMEEIEDVRFVPCREGVE